MNMGLDAVTVVTLPRNFPVTTDVVTATARADNLPAYTKRLRDHDILLLPLHLCGNHWALASLDRKTKAVSVYDSMASTMHEGAGVPNGLEEQAFERGRNTSFPRPEGSRRDTRAHPTIVPE